MLRGIVKDDPQIVTSSLSSNRTCFHVVIACVFAFSSTF